MHDMQRIKTKCGQKTEKKHYLHKVNLNYMGPKYKK